MLSRLILFAVLTIGCFGQSDTQWGEPGDLLRIGIRADLANDTLDLVFENRMDQPITVDWNGWAQRNSAFELLLILGDAPEWDWLGPKDRVTTRAITVPAFERNTLTFQITTLGFRGFDPWSPLAQSLKSGRVLSAYVVKSRGARACSVSASLSSSGSGHKVKTPMPRPSP